MSIKEEIEALRTNVTTISRNLLDLAEIEVVKIARIRIKDPHNGYQGVSHDRLGKAIKSLDALWNSYLLLARLLEEVSDLNRRSNVFHDNEEDIRKLLYGRSLELRAEHIPVTSRGLLSTANKLTQTTPQELLTAMEQQFLDARDVFTALSQSISQSGSRLDTLRQQAADLQSWSGQLGAACRLPSNLEAMLQNIDCDPLSCTGDMDAAEHIMDEQRLLLKNLEQQQTQNRAGLDEARCRLTQLQDCVQEAVAAIEEARLRILAPESLVVPVTEQELTMLHTWLAAIAQSANEGRHDAVKVGLLRWHGACMAQMAAARQACTRNRLELNEYEEITGRFKALRAMAKSYAARGVVLDEELAAMAQTVKQIIAQQPVDLDALQKAVASYEVAWYKIKATTMP
ncbi:hypothetical protein ACO0LC_06460 [Undibacterium sp. JH2W]|uniref:hypothetical protein n=1 Tax=Undibacterium sp. JH2W TaxID=3413037 RepID=UPI003BF42CA3